MADQVEVLSVGSHQTNASQTFNEVQDLLKGIFRSPAPDDAPKAIVPPIGIDLSPSNRSSASGIFEAMRS